MPGSPDNLGDLPESRSAKIALKYCLKLDPPRLAGARNKIMCFLKNLGHSRPLFSLFSSFQQLTINLFIITFSQYRIKTVDLWVAEVTSMSTATQPLSFSLHSTSGGGSVGRAVASYSRGTHFESSHWQIVINVDPIHRKCTNCYINFFPNVCNQMLKCFLLYSFDIFLCSLIF